MKSEFERLVEATHRQLLMTLPVEIQFDHVLHRKCAHKNADKLRRLSANGANLYALWLRHPDEQEWKPVYIGQRTKEKLLERLNQHLFHTPKGTQSKLKYIEAARKRGLIIGVTAAIVDPDPLRLSVEDQVIFLATATKEDLPWNRKSRKVSR